MEPKRILVADGAEVIRTLLEQALQYLEQPCEVITVPDSSTALNQARQRQFDLAVIDYQLRSLDGLQLTWLIRRNWPEMRVVLLADMDKSQLYRIRDWPALDGFFTKPFNVTRFLKVVDYLLQADESSDPTGFSIAEERFLPAVSRVNGGRSKVFEIR